MIECFVQKLKDLDATTQGTARLVIQVSREFLFRSPDNISV